MSCNIVGPAVPLNHKLDLAIRYPVSWFTIPHPEYFTPSSDSSTIAALLSTTNLKAELIKKLQSESIADPPAMWRPHKGAAVGFFEQGIIIGGSFLLTTAIAGVSTAGYFGIRYALQRLRQ